MTGDHMTTSKFLTCTLLAGLGFVSQLAQALELKVLSGNGSRPAVIALTQQFEKATGHKVTVDFFVNHDVKKKI
jgi:spermidine/putrescine-binding protein